MKQGKLNIIFCVSYMDPEPKILETFDFHDMIKDFYNGNFIINSIISGYITMILDREEITITYNADKAVFDKYILISSNFETTDIKIFGKNVYLMKEINLAKYELSAKDLDSFDEYLLQNLSKLVVDSENICLYFDFHGLNINHKYYTKVLSGYKEMVLRLKRALIGENPKIKITLGILNISEQRFEHILQNFPISRPDYKSQHRLRVLAESKTAYYMFRYSTIDFFHDIPKRWFVLGDSRLSVGNIRKHHYITEDYKLSSYFYHLLRQDKDIFKKFLTNLVITDIPKFNDNEYPLYFQMLKQILSPKYDLSKKIIEEIINDNEVFCSVFHLVKNTKVSDHFLIERGLRIFCMCNRKESPVKYMKKEQQIILLLHSLKNVDFRDIYTVNMLSKQILYILYNSKEKEYWLEASRIILLRRKSKFKVILKIILGRIGEDLENKIDFYNNLFILFLNGGTSWVDHVPREAYLNLYLAKDKSERVKKDLNRIIDGFVTIFMSSLNMDESTTSMLNVNGIVISKMYNLPVEDLKVNHQMDYFF